MFEEFESAYVFKRESPLRVKVVKFKNGKPDGAYFLLGDSCSCPAMQRTTAICKHRKMWEGAYEKDAVIGKLLVQKTKELAESLGLPFEIPDPVPDRLTVAKLGMDKKIMSDADLIVFEVPICHEIGIIELRRKQHSP